MAAVDDRTRHYDRLRPVEDERTREARQRAYQTRNLLPLLQPINPNARVVEIGPGRGATAKLLQEWGLRDYLAIEVCDEYVSELARLGFECAPAEDAGETLLQVVPDRSCDFILAIDVLEPMELDACRALLAAAERKLTQGGRLIVQVPNASAPFGINTHLADPTHVLPFNDVRLASLVRGLVQRLVFAIARLMTRALGATPVGVMTHLMIGTAVAPAGRFKKRRGASALPNAPTKHCLLLNR